MHGVEADAFGAFDCGFVAGGGAGAVGAGEGLDVGVCGEDEGGGCEESGEEEGGVMHCV